MLRSVGFLLLILACTSSPSGLDAGDDAGAGGGGGGGGADAGCAGAAIGCPCGAGGGAIYFPDRLVVASRGDGDGGFASVQVWRGHLVPSQFGPFGAGMPLLAGVPVAMAGDFDTVVIVKEGSAPGQVWRGHLEACDIPRDVPLANAGAGRAAMISKRLWFVRSPGEVVRVNDPLGSGQPTAVFAHSGQPVHDFTYDPVPNRLFAGGSDGIRVWNQAGSRAGDAGAPDFILSADETWSLALGGGRLYGAARAGQLRVWETAANLTSPRPFDFELDAGASVSIRHHAVFAGHLVVTAEDQVLIYRDIATTTANRAPDIVIDHASLTGALKSELVGSGGPLLVLTSGGVAVFSDPLGTPAFQKTLGGGGGVPVDMYYVP